MTLSYTHSQHKMYPIQLKIKPYYQQLIFLELNPTVDSGFFHLYPLPVRRGVAVWRRCGFSDASVCGLIVLLHLLILMDVVALAAQRSCGRRVADATQTPVPMTS